MRKAPSAVFDRVAKPNGEDGCWLWQGQKCPKGYGRIKMAGRKKLKAHRVAWMAVHGPIPDGLFVCHRCDVRGCVNPSHLFLGTHDDNMADMVAKGRQYKPGRKARPAKEQWRKISDADAQQIRSASRTMSQRSLAVLYRISQSYVSYIVNERVQ